MNVIEGFHNLVLLYPVIMYIARWVARSRGEDRLTRVDVERSLTFVDHHYARSPVMGWGNFRNRVRRLAEGDDIGKLIAWYAR
jgi:lysine-N-methylase